WRCPGCPGPPTLAGAMGLAPTSRRLGGLGEIGAGLSIEERPRSTTYSRRQEVRGAPRKKRIHFWLTVDLIADAHREPYPITDPAQPLTSAALRSMIKNATPFESLE